nr:hypothetical protein [Novosphingobium panipatense]
MEIGLKNWERTKATDRREETLTLIDIQLRFFVAAQAKCSFSWSAYVRIGIREYQTDILERAHGAGDVTVGLKQNLKRPQEKANGLAAGILPYLPLPTGTNQGGDGTGAPVLSCRWAKNSTIRFPLPFRGALKPRWTMIDRAVTSRTALLQAFRLV